MIFFSPHRPSQPTSSSPVASPSSPGHLIFFLFNRNRPNKASSLNFFAPPSSFNFFPVVGANSFFPPHSPSPELNFFLWKPAKQPFQIHPDYFPLLHPHSSRSLNQHPHFRSPPHFPIFSILSSSSSCSLWTTTASFHSRSQEQGTNQAETQALSSLRLSSSVSFLISNRSRRRLQLLPHARLYPQPPATIQPRSLPFPSPPSVFSQSSLGTEKPYQQLNRPPSPPRATDLLSTATGLLTTEEPSGGGQQQHPQAPSLPHPPELLAFAFFNQQRRPAAITARSRSPPVAAQLPKAEAKSAQPQEQIRGRRT